MKKLIVLTSVALLASQANAADLNQIYQQALANDAELTAAKAQRDADEYQVTLARAALLPQVSVGYTHTENDIETELIPGFTTETDYTTKTNNLNATVSQTLFNLTSWYNYQAASAGGEIAGLQYTLAEQQLILRTAEAYFNVLRAKENLETAQAEEKAVKRQLEQTRQRYEVGLIAITEVHEAEASYDLAYANLIGQEAALDISYESLEQITGQRFDKLDELKTDIAFAAPEKAVDEWVAAGLDKYAGVKVAEEGLKSAEYSRKAGWSRYAPTVNAQWQYNDGSQAARESLTTDVTSQTLVLSASVSLFAGGSNYAQAKQAAAQSAQAGANLDLQRRTVRNNIRSLYRRVQTDVLTIKARKRATISSQSALEATETGYQVGTRNIVEVLAAQRNLYSAQRDYANARYDYILNLLNLKFFSGALSEADLQALNEWLDKA